MTAPVGTEAFFSPLAKSTEDDHVRVLSETLKEKEFSHFDKKKRMKISDLLDDPNLQEYSFKKTGKSQEWESDGGFLFIGDKLVGVAESKFQSSAQNACERTFKYLAITKFRHEPWRIFVSTYGEGFSKGVVGSTGPMMDMANNAGLTVTENPNTATLRKSLRAWLRSL